ncbi:MAG: DUF4293 family protein [Bacteroidetes bacterium]|nr:MAG: DUF4293 family protein [Bacteroidota bacterium]TNF00341.1 MAG: DUF4293 family protein [Bacteroidota bacterium]
MIQRIQSVYLGIVIVLLSIVTIGVDLFSFVTETTRYTFSSYGITEYSVETGEAIGKSFFPMFIGMIALVLLTFLCLMAYKNLERQFKLGRMVFYLYFFSVAGVILLANFGDSYLGLEESNREMGLGFILFVCGFPFTFLANTGIKRDKKLLDSLNRLR